MRGFVDAGERVGPDLPGGWRPSLSDETRPSGPVTAGASASRSQPGAPEGLRRRHLPDLGAEPLEFRISDNAVLVQFGQLPERFGGVRAGWLAGGGRGPPGRRVALRSGRPQQPSAGPSAAQLQRFLGLPTGT